jgi:hypothetical protein
MSLLSLTKCFIGAGGEQAATALTTAMVKMAPETATAAASATVKRIRSGGIGEPREETGQVLGRLQPTACIRRHLFRPIVAPKHLALWVSARACSHGMAAYTEPEPITVFDDQCRITGDPDRDGRCSGGVSSS